jgi:hypothetical protein
VLDVAAAQSRLGGETPTCASVRTAPRREKRWAAPLRFAGAQHGEHGETRSEVAGQASGERHVAFAGLADARR